MANAGEIQGHCDARTSLNAGSEAYKGFEYRIMSGGQVPVPRVMMYTEPAL